MNSIKLSTPSQSAIINSVFSSGLLVAPTYNSPPIAYRIGMLYFNTTDLNLYISTAVNTWANVTNPKYTIINISYTPYSIINDDNFIVVDTSSIAVTLNLPKISTIGKKVYQIIDGAGNSQNKNIIVVAFAGDTINGSTTMTLNSNYMAVSIVNDMVSKWYIF